MYKEGCVNPANCRKELRENNVVAPCKHSFDSFQSCATSHNLRLWFSVWTALDKKHPPWQIYYFPRHRNTCWEAIWTTKFTSNTFKQEVFGCLVHFYCSIICAVDLAFSKQPICLRFLGPSWQNKTLPIGIDSKQSKQRCEITWSHLGFLCVPGSKVAIYGMVIPPSIGNPYNGYINPYYWVDDHPLSYGNNGSLDPSTCGTA